MSTDPNDPFAQFKLTFFEECAELLADMESRLAQLEEGERDVEILHAIFRAIHSIKAGGGAFGFTRLVALTHSFETLLDELREGRIDLSADLLPTLFKGFDVMSDLVDMAREEEEPDEGYGADTLSAIDAILQANEAGETSEPAAVPQANTDPKVSEVTDEAEANIVSGYRIDFRPKAALFRHANEPLLIIRELAELGELSVEVDMLALPNLDGLEPEDAYLSFTFDLKTDAPREDIDEVFEFVVDDCDLAIVTLGGKGAVREVSATPVLPAAQAFGFFMSEADILSQAEMQTAARAAASQASTQPLPANTSSAGSEKSSVAAASQGRKATAKADKAVAKVASIRVDIDRVDRLVNMVGELVITHSMLGQEIAALTGSAGGRVASGMEELSMHIRELQDNVMAIRMQPVKSVFARMPRLVRDVSGKLGKKVRLEMIGENTEVDKTVIEELADPLTHMIRNSLDHGIEMPEERVAAGKPEEGQIRLSAEHRGGRIVIAIEDDGAGINRERVRAKAVERGIIRDDEELPGEDIDNLIFAPGFSTAEQVTDLSGRGVGMDVVRRNIQSLGGRVSVFNKPGEGARMQLTLPLTLAVLDGMVVGIARQHYVVPINNIIETVRPAPEEVYQLAGGEQVVRIRGDYIRLVPLAGLFGVEGAQCDPSKGLVVLVEADGGRIVGLVVDHLVGQQQVVIKSLERNYGAIEGIASATILGDGSVCLILDIDTVASMSRADRPLDERQLTMLKQSTAAGEDGPSPSLEAASLPAAAEPSKTE